MKTKLLTICLLLVTSQVFAAEKIIKCEYGKSISVYKYSESFFGLFKKIQYRDEIEWRDWCPMDRDYELRELEKSNYGGRCTTIYGVKVASGEMKEKTSYIDFIQPTKKIKIFFKNNVHQSYNLECRFIYEYE